MKELKGLYIEDEPDNIIMLQALFSLESGVVIEGLDYFPENIEKFGQIVIDKKYNFLIIDHELDKMADYHGSQVLREIRKQDSTIYAILLTNFKLEDYKDELGEYDFQLNKNDLKEPGKLKELVCKIRRACELRADNRILAEMEMRKAEGEDLYRKLEQISRMIKKE